MPELPEVETVRRGLAPALIGQSFNSIILTDFPGVLGHISLGEATARITQRRVAAVSRRGKFLIVGFDDESGVIVHLRMTGVLTLEEPALNPPRFHRLTLVLANGHELRFADQRKFGRVEAATATDIAALDARLGPEPLSSSFTAQHLAQFLEGRRAPIKSLLLDQRIVAGLGNIYVDEALFLAGIHPQEPAGSLALEKLELLLEIIAEVLNAGIERRGVSFSSFRDVYGASGENQQHLVVYGRGKQGSPCFRCGAPLQRIVVGNRGTSFCPACQPLGQ